VVAGSTESNHVANRRGSFLPEAGEVPSEVREAEGLYQPGNHRLPHTLSKRRTIMLDKLANTISGWRFAAFIITLAVAVTLILVAILLIPASQTGLGAFATDFKIWCFGYDPATGGMEWAYVVVMLANPLILATFVYLVWFRDLHEALHRKRRSVATTAAVGLLAAGMLGGGLFALGPKKVEATQLPFPAERLRTELEPPDFELIDQQGETVSLEALRGQVVLVTAIYASCHTACPMIVIQTRKALNGLTDEQREEVTVVAITLDPENDTPESLPAAAEAHQFEAPLWRFVSGEPDTVNDVLDKLGVSRFANEETGEIDHANMFFLIDRQGKIAFRLNLGDRHATWLKTGLEVLIEERLRD
jgi:protein SCO1